MNWLSALLPVGLLFGVAAAAWAGFSVWVTRGQHKTMLEEGDALPGPDEVQRRAA